MTFQDEAVKGTVEKLIKGEDYREEVVNAINLAFLEFSIKFFKQIVEAKMNNTELNMDWYKSYFINADRFSTDDIVVFAGMNKKTITNMYGTARKNVVLDVANDNLEYLSGLITSLEENSDSEIAITLKLSYNNITVELNLAESLLAINALATKKLQIRGGSWSAIGKNVEKPLLDKLCELAGVPKENINNSHFKKDTSKRVDREIDYKLIGRDGTVYKIEVKLMGKGNPESADATIARDSDIFVADTLSRQNCNQLSDRGTKYVILKDNPHSLEDFKQVLTDLDIPFSNN